MNKFEKLFAAKAVVKEINSRLSELEKECKAELLEEYEKDGTDRKRSRIFGSKNAYLTVQEGKPSEEAERFDVTDPNALLDWFEEAEVDTWKFAYDHVREYAEWHFRKTGECPDGCTLLRYMTEPTAPIVKLCVKEKAVLPILQEQAEMLEGTNRLLLGDGDD